MRRWLVDASAIVRLEPTDAAGELLEGVTGATLTITNSAGTEIAGSPFTAVEDSGEDGTFQVAIPAAALGELDTFDLDWSITIGSTTEHRRDQAATVGAFLFDLRGLRLEYPEYDDDAKWPAWKLLENRDEVADTFESIAIVSLWPAARTITTTCPVGTTLDLPDIDPTRILAATVDGTPLDQDQLDAITLLEWGGAHRSEGWGATATVRYQHGLDAVPRDVARAARLLARATLSPGPGPSRATSITTDTGSYRITIAGRDGETGLPDVDVVLNRWGNTTLYAT